MFVTVIIKIIDIELDEKPVFLLLMKNNIAMVEVKYFSQMKMACAVMKISLLKV